jgi:hypothetical protein
LDIYERHAIEHECEKLINRYYHFANVDMGQTVDLFATDGYLQWPSKKVGPGHEDMRTFLHRASKNMLDGVEVVMNTVSNIVIDVIDETSAKGVSYDTFWEHGYYDGDLQGRPAPITSPIGLQTWDDEFRLEHGEWKFQSRKMTFVFNNKFWKLQRVGRS